MAVWSIVRFNVLSDYKIEVSFADGTSGVADLAPRLSQGPLGDGYDALCDQAVFAKVYLEYGALTWPGGIDLAPDAMYQRIRETGNWHFKSRSKEPQSGLKGARRGLRASDYRGNPEDPIFTPILPLGLDGARN